MNDESLKFSETWQEAILGYMLENYTFFLGCYAHLQSSWFTNEHVRDCVDLLFSSFKKLENKQPLRASDLEGLLCVKYIEPSVLKTKKAALYKAIQSAKAVNFELLVSELTSWIKVNKLYESLSKSEKLFNSRQYEQTLNFLGAAIKDAFAVNFLDSGYVSFDNPLDFYQKRKEDLKDCLTLGHPDFDEQMRPGSKIIHNSPQNFNDLNNLKNSTYGSLAKGDVTVIIGPTNVGKTTVCITILCWNVKMEKDILFISLEQKPDDIKNKIYQCMTNRPSATLHNVTPNTTYFNELLAASHFLEKYLTYISILNPSKLFIEDLSVQIERAQEHRIAKTGKGFDLLIVDYPGRLNSKIFSYKKSSAWEEKAYVYDQLYNLARHHNMHALLPVQTNREGFKVNRSTLNRFVDVDDIAQSFNITHGADNVITINRAAQHEAYEGIMLYVAKSRLGKKGWVFVSKSNFACSRSHGGDLPFKISLSSDRAKADNDLALILQSSGFLNVEFEEEKQILRQLSAESNKITVQSLKIDSNQK